MKYIVSGCIYAFLAEMRHSISKYGIFCNKIFLIKINHYKAFVMIPKAHLVQKDAAYIFLYCSKMKKKILYNWLKSDLCSHS